MRGLVIKNTGSWYSVRTDDGHTVACKIKGNFRLKSIRSTNPVVIGDRVQIEPNSSGTAFITAIEPRTNYMIRRASNLSRQSHILAANIDQALLIVTVNYPVTTTTFIDRFLATAEAYAVPTAIVFNKTDRYDDDELEYLDALIHLYTVIGYPCHKICALNGDGMAPLESAIEGRVSLLAGHSGSGKSTLINSLLPDAQQRTGAISEYHKMGMHTTTFSEMLPLPGGGYLIDTPGIKGFGTVEMETGEVSHYFPEFFRFAADCRFHNCTHRNEPGCKVVEAVNNHHISESRYRSYLSILGDEADGKYREEY